MPNDMPLKTIFLLNFAKKYFIEILLVILIIFLFCSHIQWISKNELLKYEVDQEHTPKAMFYYKHLSASFSDFLNAFSIIRSDTSYWPPTRPPTVYVFTSLINCIIGFSILKMQAAFFLFFLILILSTYLITKTLSDKKIGLFAAVLAAFNPLVFHYSHIYNQDLPLAAMAALGFYFLILCANFKSFKYSISLGIIFGLGVLSKPTFIIYLFAPMMLCLYQALKPLLHKADNDDHKKITPANKKIILNIIIFSSIFIMLAWSWFGYKLKWLFPNMYCEFYINKGLNTYENPLSFYLLNFYKKCGLILFLLFFASIPLAFSFKHKQKTLLVCCILSSYAFLSLISNKQMRFALPIMPLIAVFSAISICAINSTSIKKNIIRVVVLLLFYQFIYLSFFYKTTTFPLSNIHSLLFADSNNPPLKYWDSVEGKFYISFLKEKFAGQNNKQAAIKDLFYNSKIIIDYHKPHNSVHLSPNNAFKQYLLFKQPDLLMQHLTDKELSLLFITY